jgi:ABC-type polysaccharide transport system permease subunit
MTEMQIAKNASEVKFASTGKEPRGKFVDGIIRFKSQIVLQIMVIPGIIWLIVFCYIPM